MDYDELRFLLRPAVGNLKDLCTNSTMPELCAGLGLPWPPDGPDKRGRLHRAFDLLPDDDLSAFGWRFIAHRHVSGQARNNLQEVLWSTGPTIELPKRARRELAKALQSVTLFRDWPRFKKLLDSLFLFPMNIAAMFGEGRDPLEAIYEHFVGAGEDVVWLFDELEVYELSDNRFRRFIEGLTSADLQKEVEHQHAVVGAMNSVLREYGAELRETGQDGGYPLFEVTSLRTAGGRPKNIIFASTSKPDIRFRSAISNDIEIASRQEEVLVYDRPLGAAGLTWKELQSWWADLTGEPDAQRAKESLYRRLARCLPASSPPQRLLFRTFFELFRLDVPVLPALLPEVWLHWDPRTVEQRGPEALLTQRMDFLMLMPGGARVVIEVDGKQHYADENGHADPRRYAHTMAGHRELALSGYDVYRFAGIELQGDAGKATVKAFFDALFARHALR